MSIDLYAKAVNLLEQLANSIHERDPSIVAHLVNNNSLCFTKKEVHMTEEWLKAFIEETTK